MTTRNIYDLADTWNDGATTFTAIKMNVTDTASASASLLMDLQVGGASRFRASKDGSFGGRDPIFGSFTISASQARISFAPPTSPTMFGMSFAGAFTAVESFRLGSSNPDTATLHLFRDANDTLAQRRGTNAQAFNIYNTYTDASNYERGFMRWSSNELQIGTESTGTGGLRGLTFNSRIDCKFQRNGVLIASYSDSEFSILKKLDVTLEALFRASRFRLLNLPTADPIDAGAVWNDSGTLKISAG